MPLYMIPTIYMKVEEFKITSNGKLDREKLPKIDIEKIRKKKYQLPRNKTDKLLVRIWKKILKIREISIKDDFIERFTDVMSPYKEGTCPVRVFYQREEASAMLELGVQWRITPADALLYELKTLLGDESVTMEFK